MSGHFGVNELALFAGGDLPGEERVAISEHLRECVECREQAASFEALGGSLREFAIEPADEDLRLMRESVAHRIDAGKRGSLWNWCWACLPAGLAAASILTFIGVHRTTPPESVKILQATTLSPQPLPQVPLVIALAEPKPKVKPLHKSEAGIRTVSLVARKDGSSVLRMTTADPNVLILLPLGKEVEAHEN